MEVFPHKDFIETNLEWCYLPHVIFEYFQLLTLRAIYPNVLVFRVIWIKVKVFKERSKLQVYTTPPHKIIGDCLHILIAKIAQVESDVIYYTAAIIKMRNFMLFDNLLLLFHLIFKV